MVKVVSTSRLLCPVFAPKVTEASDSCRLENMENVVRFLELCGSMMVHISLALCLTHYFVFLSFYYYLLLSFNRYSVCHSFLIYVSLFAVLPYDS